MNDDGASRKREGAILGGQIISSNTEHMRAIGRLGGLKTSRDREHMARIGAKGGAGSKRKQKCVRSTNISSGGE